VISAFDGKLGYIDLDARLVPEENAQISLEKKIV
jgi:hypothetical protein